MPKPGYTTITFHADTYEYIYESFRKLEPELRRKGITSLSGFVSKMTCEAIEQKYGLKP